MTRSANRQHLRRTRRVSGTGRVPRGTGAVLAVAGFALVGSACGNWIEPPTDAGQVGVTVDGAGQPVIAVMTCSTATPVVTLYEGRKKSDPGSKQNVQRGGWEARRGFSGVRQIAIFAPGGAWKTTTSARPLEPGTLFLLGGGTLEDEHASLTGPNFRVEDLAALAPGQVLAYGKTVSLRTFGAYQCR